MYYTKNGKIPDECWYHDPKISDNKFWTVAMHLINNNIIPPEKWCYNPDINNRG